MRRQHPMSQWAAGLALVSVMLAACDDDDDAVRGSGTLATEERPVSGFDDVALEGIGELLINVEGTESLVIEAEDNLLPLLTSEVTGSTLTLGSREAISPTEPITYTVGAAALEGVSISGIGEVVVPNVACENFAVDLSGTGTFDVGGECDRLELSISGSGDFDGGELAVANASVSISGSGEAIVNVTDELHVSISGSGDVEYIGDPATDVEIDGAGDVRQRQA